MNASVLRFADVPVSRWRNGGGRTREIARQPARDVFDWRVSVAEVAGDTEFSTFPGVDRVIIFCEGPAMTLDIDGTEYTLQHHAPFAFAGESATSCRVPGGPTRDLNVMTRRDRCTAAVSVLYASDHDIEIEDPHLTLAVALAGHHDVRLPRTAGPVRLKAFDAIRVGQVHRLRVAGSGPMAIIHITPVTAGVPRC